MTDTPKFDTPLLCLLTPTGMLRALYLPSKFASYPNGF